MKTAFFKKILPALAIMLAIGGAFGTYAMSHSEGKSGNFVGYIKNNLAGTDCSESTLCSYVNAELCTVNAIPEGTQLWAQNAQGRCIVEVYRIHP